MSRQFNVIKVPEAYAFIIEEIRERTRQRLERGEHLLFRDLVEEIKHDVCVEIEQIATEMAKGEGANDINDLELHPQPNNNLN